MLPALLPVDPASAESLRITLDNGEYDPDIEYPGDHQHGPYDYLEGGARIKGFWAAQVGTPEAHFWLGHTHIGENNAPGFDGHAELQHAWTNDLIGLYISFEDGRTFDLVSIDYRIRRRESEDPEQERLPWSYALDDVHMLVATEFDPTQTDFEAQWTGFDIDDGTPHPTLGIGHVPKETPWATQDIPDFEDITGFFLTSSATVMFDSIELEWAACGNGVVELREQCEEGADDACPGLCLSDCRCDLLPDGLIPDLGGIVTGEVDGESRLEGACSSGSANSPEVILDWMAPQSGVISLDTCSLATDFDTVVYVRESSTEGPEVACNDDTIGCEVNTDHPRSYRQGSRVEFPVTAGQLYRVIVDGWVKDVPIDNGAFELDVVPLTSCGNQVQELGEECDGVDDGVCPGACAADCTCGAICGDGILDDGEVCDGASDAACPGACLSDCSCDSGTPAVCGDGIADTGEQCDGGDAAACPGACQADCTCAPGTAPEIDGEGGTFSGEVAGYSAHEGACSANSALHPEAVLDWIPAFSTTFSIETCSDGTDFDTVLYVREGGVDGPELACNDDTPGCAVASGESNAHRQGSHVEIAVEAGHLYQVFVDGWTRSQTTAPGAFDLSVVPLFECGNDVLEPGEACDGAQDGACPGLCLGDCTCDAPPPPPAVCGNDVLEAGEACDGAQDGACPGLCLGDCTCDAPPPPPAVCGNDLLEAGEACDGAQDAACPGLCLGDCTCDAPPQAGDLPGEGGTLVGEVGGPSEYEGSCSANTSLHPETVVEWTPAVSGTVQVATCSDATDFDTVLYVREGGVDGPEIACNDDTVGCGVATGHHRADRQGSRVEFPVEAGQVYEIFVDGWTSSATTEPGTFDLQVTPLAACGNDVLESGEACDGAQDAACPGQCLADCTCDVPPPPPAVCGNDVLESGEACDGAQDGACPGLCLADCTCDAPPQTGGLTGEGGTLVGEVGGPSEYEGSCSANTALHPETLVEWTPTVSGTVQVATCSDATDFDTVLYVREGGVDGSEIACNDDTVGCGVATGHHRADRQGSRVEFPVEAGQVYEIFVDGWSSSATTEPGTFDLQVTPVGP